METSANPIYPENDPRHHTVKIRKVLEDLVADLQENTTHFDEPKVQKLFETSAAVLQGLCQAFDQYETHAEPAARR